MSGQAVVLDDVRKTFRPPASARALLRGRLRGAPVVALDGVTLRVARGAALALMGANGAGKSTLLRLVAGLLTPTAGRVTVVGLDPTRERQALARRVGYVAGDELALAPLVSPREHLAFYATLHGHGRREALARADALIERLGLSAAARRPLRELSTGQRRRTALARALLAEPELVVLDEPTRGIDPAGVSALWADLAAERQRGRTLVIATHHVDEARALAAEVAVVCDGRLRAVVPPERALEELSAHG